MGLALLAKLLFMENFLIAHDALLRIYALFIGSLVLLWESGFPAVAQVESIKFRWPRNILLFVFDILLSRIVMPISTLGLAIVASKQGWGIFNQIEVSAWLEVLLGIFALDVTAYILHVALHRIPYLWRIHAVHHCDRDFDCTTGLRFHPFEALMEIAVRLAAIAALGVPVVAIVIYETWAIIGAFYTHANITIPQSLDRCARNLMVTPNMHRIHHSAAKQDGMSNYGVIFTVWDRIFSTYRDQSVTIGGNLITGLPWFNSRPDMGIAKLIALPINPTPFHEEGEEHKARGK